MQNGEVDEEKRRVALKSLNAALHDVGNAPQEELEHRVEARRWSKDPGAALVASGLQQSFQENELQKHKMKVLAAEIELEHQLLRRGSGADQIACRFESIRGMLDDISPCGTPRRRSRDDGGARRRSEDERQSTQQTAGTEPGLHYSARPAGHHHHHHHHHHQLQVIQDLAPGVVAPHPTPHLAMSLANSSEHPPPAGPAGATDPRLDAPDHSNPF